MAQCSRVLTKALILFTILATDGRGQRLLEVDGIELHGAVQLVMSGGGTCNVLESDTSFEARKGNHGASMDIWRLDFSVLNASGRWLDHLIARYQIESKWPECTNWDGPEAGVFSQNIEWADSVGHIQKSGRNVIAPGQTLSATKFFIVLRGDPQPRFENWSVDFDFAVAPPTADSAAGAAGSPAANQVPAATAEQERFSGSRSRMARTLRSSRRIWRSSRTGCSGRSRRLVWRRYEVRRTFHERSPAGWEESQLRRRESLVQVAIRRAGQATCSGTAPGVRRWWSCQAAGWPWAATR